MIACPPGFTDTLAFETFIGFCKPYNKPNNMTVAKLPSSFFVTPATGSVEPPSIAFDTCFALERSLILKPLDQTLKLSELLPKSCCRT
jgi:hypothetical protein